jgi:outer membrane biosynthesis protein TonB
MKDVQMKGIQIGGYLRIIAIAIALIFTVIGVVKAHAIAPHVPDVGLQAKVDYHRESTEKARNKKASEKVDKHKEHKEKKKAEKAKKDSGAKKDKKTKKEKKPKKPSKDDKKRAAKHKMDNMA